MKLRCSCGASDDAVVVEYYCKVCRAYRCDACVKPCKERHPDYILDGRVLKQMEVRLVAALSKSRAFSQAPKTAQPAARS